MKRYNINISFEFEDEKEEVLLRDFMPGYNLEKHLENLLDYYGIDYDDIVTETCIGD